jgi:hypothetical protein
MNDEHRTYAESLGELLSSDLGTTFLDERSSEIASDKVFAAAFCWHAKKVYENKEDFGSLLILELYKDKLVGKTVERQRLHKVLTRIRKRLAREIRETHIPDIDAAAHDDAANRDFVNALLELHPDEALIADELLKRRDLESVRSALGISRSEFYRRRRGVKEKLKKLLQSSPDQ